MTDSLAKYKETREAVRKQIDEARSYVKEAFEIGAKELLKDLGIKSFSWTQYTPYFNDGDACVFGVRSDYPTINGANLNYGDDEEDDGTEIPRYGTPEYDLYEDTKVKPVADFLRQFDDDDMEFMFGDHVEITVTASGIEVDNYEHD